MKKVFLSVALALAVAGSWAFYPKAPAEPSGYMLVSSRINRDNGSIVTIEPNGAETIQLIPVHVALTLEKTDAAYQELHKQEILKLNALKGAGWKLLTSSYSNDQYSSTRSVYLLER